MSLAPEEENQKIYYLIITIFEVQKCIWRWNSWHISRKRRAKNYIVRIYIKSLILLVRKSWPGMVKTKMQHKKYRSLKAEALIGKVKNLWISLQQISISEDRETISVILKEEKCEPRLSI